jgi:putative oxidoreductase
MNAKTSYTDQYPTDISHNTQPEATSTSRAESSRLVWADRMLGVFRIVAGLIFISSGTMKVFNYPPNPMPNMPPFHPLTQMGIGAMLEMVGGLLIMIGLFTRPVAFVLAGVMAVAYFQFHAPQSFFPTVNGGIPAILYCFFFLYLMFAGAGAWSLDALLGRLPKASGEH